MKMSNKDKDSFIIIGVIAGIPLLSGLFYLSFKFINPVYLALLVLVVQYFGVTPSIVKMYYKMLDAKPGIGAYVPIYNELLIYSPGYAKVSLGIWLADVLALALAFIDNSVYEVLFGRHMAFNITTTIIWVAVLIYLIQCIIRGVAMCKLSSFVYRKRAEFYRVPVKVSILQVMQYVLFFVPIIRIVSFSLLFDKLFALTKVNDYKKEERRTLEEE